MMNLAALQEERQAIVRKFLSVSLMDPECGRKQNEVEKERNIIDNKIRACKKEIHDAKSAMPYTDAIAIEICERISCGELLIDICLEEHMPYPKTVMEWVSDSRHADFAQLYRQARGHRLDIFEEQIIKISDDATGDLTSNGKTNGNAVARAKVKIDTRLRHLRAYRSDRWSESMTVKNVDASEDLSTLDNIELEKRIAELDKKDRIIKDDIGSGIGELRDNVTNLATRRAGRDLFG
jgi:hypothetical protein